MLLELQEPHSRYLGATQRARVMTESWLGGEGYCPGCGRSDLSRMPVNSPVSDYACRTCNEEFELKSSKVDFGRRVVDGAYDTMIRRLSEDNNPSLFLLRYDPVTAGVVSMLVVPRQFFTADIIERRKPLSQTARRSGWVGCNIMLDRIPALGRIHIVRDRLVRPKSDVVKDWARTNVLKQSRPQERGWLLDVLRCVESLGKAEFTLSEMYGFDRHLGKLHPENRNVRAKIRQQLQRLRDRGLLTFKGGGAYGIVPVA